MGEYPMAEPDANIVMDEDRGVRRIEKGRVDTRGRGGGIQDVGEHVTGEHP